jgi:hypothetical protein
MAGPRMSQPDYINLWLYIATSRDIFECGMFSYGRVIGLQILWGRRPCLMAVVPEIRQESMLGANERLPVIWIKCRTSKLVVANTKTDQ